MRHFLQRIPLYGIAWTIISLAVPHFALAGCGGGGCGGYGTPASNMSMGRVGMMSMQPNPQNAMGGGCRGMMNMQSNSVSGMDMMNMHPNQPSGMMGGRMGMMNMNGQMTNSGKPQGAKSHNGNAGSDMQGMDMNSDHLSTPASSGASAPAQVPTMFRCPMHPTIMSTFPAKCPMCGMDLTKG